MKKHSRLNRVTLYDYIIAIIVIVWIKGFTLDAYKNILKEKQIWTGYRNTIIYTFAGTLYNLVLTIPAAYVLTKKDMPFRGFISWFFFITMYVSGGMIPSYLLIKDLGLINNPLVMIVGAGVSCYNLIVTRQYFSSGIPEDLYEAAYIDGAGDGRCFLKIALQQVLNKILTSNLELKLDETMDADMVAYALKQYHAAQGMKYSIIFVGSLPLLIAYPFLQKYFAKGIMIGSVKG